MIESFVQFFDCLVVCLIAWWFVCNDEDNKKEIQGEFDSRENFEVECFIKAFLKT